MGIQTRQVEIFLQVNRNLPQSATSFFYPRNTNVQPSGCIIL